MAMSLVVGIVYTERSLTNSNDRKKQKIETQSTRLEQLNTGYNVLASIKKKKKMIMFFRILPAPTQENET